MSDAAEPNSGVEAHDQAVANLVKAADRFAATAATEGWGKLDFTPDSLGELDTMLTRFLAGGPLSNEILGLSIAYLGETMVRLYGCSWGDTDQWLVLPPSGSKDGSEPADVFHMMESRLGRKAAPLESQVEERVNAWKAEP